MAGFNLDTERILECLPESNLQKVKIDFSNQSAGSIELPRADLVHADDDIGFYAFRLPIGNANAGCVPHTYAEIHQNIYPEKYRNKPRQAAQAANTPVQALGKISSENLIAAFATGGDSAQFGNYTLKELSRDGEALLTDAASRTWEGQEQAVNNFIEENYQPELDSHPWTFLFDFRIL